MLRSMTGFGNGKAKTKFGTVIAEIKTVNHKFLEITPKLPASLNILEDKVKEVIQREVSRGKVYLNLIYEGEQPTHEIICLDVGLAKSYYKKLNDLKKVLNIKEEIGLRDIVVFPGVLNVRVTEREVYKLWPVIEKAVAKAVAKLVHEREKEGKHLAVDLKKRLSNIKKHLGKIGQNSHINVRNYKKKLENKIEEISGMPAVNNDRLEMEVALYAKNSDITEEITRLSGHVINFDSIIKQDNEAGKKLDFVAQEMHREINTIGSKSSDYNISRSVIEIKSEIEKIREQLKNLE